MNENDNTNDVARLEDELLRVRKSLAFITKTHQEVIGELVALRIERDGYTEEVKRLRRALQRSLALIAGLKDLSAKAEPDGYKITADDRFMLWEEVTYIRDTLGSVDDD